MNYFSSIGDKQDKTATVSLFSFDNRRSTVNVSGSWLLNLQLSRFFFTRSVDLWLFEIASESTGRLENESMCKEGIVNIGYMTELNDVNDT